jgi:putative ABC transport system substrate-binding protein
MRRHRALAVIAASLILFVTQAGGQQPVHRIGVLSVTESPERMLEEGLRERGYVVGLNLQIEYRFSQGRTEQIPALVAELVAFGPEVIVAVTTPNAVAVHAAAPNIPLVFVNVGDPVAVGLVENLAHPGGNVTGFATLVPEGFVGKQLQFLKAIVPQASRIAVVVNPTNPFTGRSCRGFLRSGDCSEWSCSSSKRATRINSRRPSRQRTPRVPARSTSSAIRYFWFTGRRSWGSPLAIGFRRFT